MPHDTPSSASPGRHAPEFAMRASRSVTTLSVVVAGVLVAVKMWAYMFSHSIAMLASFADSALDLAASLMTFFAVRYAAAPADREHRFGHGKAESFASLFQALLVAVSAALVARESVARLIAPQDVHHGLLAMGVMGFSIILTVFLISMQTLALRKTGSIAIAGDKAHYASDLIANIAVVAGIGLSALSGLLWADALVGLGIAGWLVWSAWQVARQALDQMLDRELPDAERKHIIDIARHVPGVLSVHELRTRASGLFVHIQFHVDLDPKITLAAAHAIVVEVERRLLEAFPAADILIHPDPKGEAEPHGSRYFQRDKSRS